MKFALSMLALLAVPCAAQAPKVLPPIDTDRPDLTDGTATVARGHVQFESGYTVVKSRYGLTTITVPELFARIGLSSQFELRIGETFQSVDVTGQPTGSSGWDDLQLGTKIRLAPQRGNRPSFSMELFTSLPTGADGISAGRALPGGAILAEWDGEGPWAIGAEVQASRDPEDGISWTPSISIQFRPVDAWQFYGEFYSTQSTGAVSPGESYFNTGVLLLLSNNVQVDAKFGVGLNHAAAKNYFGMGLSLRR
jgi:Putative MetA-pathway of phenol degradation